MDVPARNDTRGTDDARVRLRREVYQALVAERGATSVADQVRLIGLPRKTLYRIRRGDAPSLATAMKIADALDVPMSALFERVKAAA